MKNNEQTKKEFDTVAFFRKVKEQIAKELEGKSFEQQKALIKKFLAGELKFKISN
ncbi:MAG: hypothetical protein KGZ58_09130 [Ignavibacteriales bacterium]|nr:hypothetical protein [Ignavibacteriales bacterium]